MSICPSVDDVVDCPILSSNHLTNVWFKNNIYCPIQGAITVRFIEFVSNGICRAKYLFLTHTIQCVQYSLESESYPLDQNQYNIILQTTFHENKNLKHKKNTSFVFILIALESWLSYDLHLCWSIMSVLILYSLTFQFSSLMIPFSIFNFLFL